MKTQFAVPVTVPAIRVRAMMIVVDLAVLVIWAMVSANTLAIKTRAVNVAQIAEKTVTDMTTGDTMATTSIKRRTRQTAAILSFISSNLLCVDLWM
jgi:hypothetical protein